MLVMGIILQMLRRQLTKLARKNPRMIAEELLNNFNNENANVEKVEIAWTWILLTFL